MGERNRPQGVQGVYPGDGEETTVRRWTFWEILGLLVSAILVAAPLLSLGYTFLFPAPAPAQVLVDTPTPAGTPTATWTPGGPTVPTVPTNTSQPTVPTDTPGTPPTTVPTTPVTPPTTVPTTPGGIFTANKVANKDVAYVGDVVIFSIGLSNATGGSLLAIVDDTLPVQFGLDSVTHNCASGTITPGAGSFHAELTVPAGQACQIFVYTTVLQGCNCYVQNVAQWSAGSFSGDAYSQPIFLSLATVTPSPTTGTPVTPPTTVPTTPVTPPTTVPTTPVTPPTTVPTTPVTPPTTGPTTPVTPPTTVPTTPVTPPTTVPTTPVTPPTTVPTTPAGPPTPGPTPPPRPTDRPAPEPTVPPPLPTPLCAQARVVGDVCGAGVNVTISSCCPEWSASTTSGANGRFEFSGLTPGTFTVRARGRSRTINLPNCDSVATVNLCPVTAVPTTPTTLETALPVPTYTLPTAPPPGTHPPSTGDVTLRLEADRTIVQPGDNVDFVVTLRNEQDAALQNIVVQGTFSTALALHGGASAGGDVKLIGQDFSLSASQLVAGKDLVLYIDSSVRYSARPWAVVILQAESRAAGRATIYSNYVELQIVGGGEPPPEWQTPVPTFAPGGAGEAPVSPVPTQRPGGLGTEMPATGTGLPIVGVMLGGVTLLARQVRLRRAQRRES